MCWRGMCYRKLIKSIKNRDAQTKISLGIFVFIRNFNAMRQFKKKPVIIQATQLINNEFRSLDDIPLPDCKDWRTGRDEEGFFVAIPTLEGIMKARNNDWIIRGVSGEYCPCKPDIFEKTYEEVFISNN